MESLAEVIARQKQEVLKSEFPECTPSIDVAYSCDQLQRRKRHADAVACQQEHREMKWCVLSTWCPSEARELRACLPGRRLLAGRESVPKQCKRAWKAYDECMISFQVPGGDNK